MLWISLRFFYVNLNFHTEWWLYMLYVNLYNVIVKYIGFMTFVLTIENVCFPGKCSLYILNTVLTVTCIVSTIAICLIYSCITHDEQYENWYHIKSCSQFTSSVCKRKIQTNSVCETMYLSLTYWCFTYPWGRVPTYTKKTLPKRKPYLHQLWMQSLKSWWMFFASNYITYIHR